MLGAWRITGSDLWDRDYLDPTGPAKLSIKSDGQGEIAFFRWNGVDEMDEVTGSGSAELLDDGTREIMFIYDNGDEAIITAIKENFSAACRDRGSSSCQSFGGQCAASKWRDFWIC